VGRYPSTAVQPAERGHDSDGVDNYNRERPHRGRDLLPPEGRSNIQSLSPVGDNCPKGLTGKTHPSVILGDCAANRGPIPFVVVHRRLRQEVDVSGDETSGAVGLGWSSKTDDEKIPQFPALLTRMVRTSPAPSHIQRKWASRRPGVSLMPHRLCSFQGFRFRTMLYKSGTTGLQTGRLTRGDESPL
jgi:hypothetical protein